MALPSTRRPQELQEEFIKKDVQETTTGSETKQAAVAKLKVNFVNLFMKGMIDWYKGLTLKQQTELTKKRVIRRGIYFAQVVMRYSYEKLPTNWLQKLHDEHGVRFKFNSSRKRKRSPELPETPANCPSKKSKNTKLSGKFIDLTNMPPPKAWMDAYLKDNTILPRQLKVHKTTEKTILYYDYEEHPEQVKDRKYYSMRHDRDGVFGTFLDDTVS